MNRLAPVMLTATLLAGCATPTDQRIPLSGKDRNYIVQHARSAEELGISVDTDAEGNLQLAKTLSVPLGIAGNVPLQVRSENGARFPLLRIRINDKPVLALLDTGMARSLIDVDGARRTGVSPISYTRVVQDGTPSNELLMEQSPSPAGATHQFVALARSVSMGDLKVYNVPFGILDDERGFGSLWWLDGQRAEAILGNNVLSAFDHFTIDLGSETLRVASGRYRPDPDRLIVAVPLLDRFSVPAVEAFIDENGPYYVVLDTGAKDGLWIPNRVGVHMQLPELKEPPPPPTGRKGSPRSISLGERTINIGGFDITQVPVFVGLLKLGEDEPPFALLGNPILKNYTTTIDAKAGKVYFERP